MVYFLYALEITLCGVPRGPSLDEPSPPCTKRKVPMERRKHPRAPFQCQISFSRQEMSEAGTVSNLAVGGCKVESKASVYIGMYLTLQIHLPGHDSPLKLDQAVVRWAKEHEFGLEFTSMRPEEEERLRDVVSLLEAG